MAPFLLRVQCLVVLIDHSRANGFFCFLFLFRADDTIIQVLNFSGFHRCVIKRRPLRCAWISFNSFGFSTPFKVSWLKRFKRCFKSAPVMERYRLLAVPKNSSL